MMAHIIMFIAVISGSVSYAHIPVMFPSKDVCEYYRAAHPGIEASVEQFKQKHGAVQRV